MRKIARQTCLLGALCLFGSGFSALIYQATWLREFRLIFGASTAATAAVTAIFMGGLFLGSIYLGKRADQHPKPLLFYAQLELAVALSAALTPFLLLPARALYLALGGSQALGIWGSTVIRLALALILLIVPTFCMGGTLPALLAFVQSNRDPKRRTVSLLYGFNTAGAVLGTLLATFVLLEHFGNRLTLWLACALNLAVALAAWRAAGVLSQRVESAEAHQLPLTLALCPSDREREKPSHPWVYAAAGLAGFVFFLMELVWYRMLAPLLGGSTFTFGLILAVALAGIALGSLSYSALGRQRPSWKAFAIVSGLEALGLALPYAIGDYIALGAMVSQPLGNLSFTVRVLEWTAIAAVVILPAAFMSGIQFPLLIAMLGRGREGIGAQTGAAYGWNTLGAIAGSIAGGFGLLTWLSAPGAWRCAVVILVLLSLAAAVQAARGQSWRMSQVTPWLITGLALAMLTATGPTAVWRHNPTGAGRSQLSSQTANDYKKFMENCRAKIEWEADGLESSIALVANDGYAFVVNGKSDGHSVWDAGTQVMSGLLGALFLPQARSACVIGLGTGSTAGWLADVESVNCVDVFELEPAVRRVAADCAPVNHHVLQNPKVHLIYGDARELLLTGRNRYDLIFSEPSNPYRAGISSLFTLEYYQAVAQRLRPEGIFVQWVQGYEIDGLSLSSIYATLASVFPSVETWQSTAGDLLLVCGRQPLTYDLSRISRRLTQPPFQQALNLVWYVNDVEGVFAHFLANNELSRAAMGSGVRSNTDNRNGLEFALARMVGQKEGIGAEHLITTAFRRGWNNPAVTNGVLDRERLMDRRSTKLVLDDVPINDLNQLSTGLAHRTRAKQTFAKGELKSAAQYWKRQSQPPSDPYELLLVALAGAPYQDPEVPKLAEQLRPFRPADADTILVHYYWNGHKIKEALPYLKKVLAAWREAPWVGRHLASSTFDLIELTDFGDNAREVLLDLYQELEKPLAVKRSDGDRIDAWLAVARELDASCYSYYTQHLCESLEPYFPWRKDYLRVRADCYAQTRHPAALQARASFEQFERNESRAFLLDAPASPLPLDRETVVSAREKE